MTKTLILIWMALFSAVSWSAFGSEAQELAIVNWLKPLMGDHIFPSGSGCDKVQFENITKKWDRFALISFNVFSSEGNAGDFVYHSSYSADRNCKIRSGQGGQSRLVCNFGKCSGTFCQEHTKNKIEITKGQDDQLIQFDWKRRSNVPTANIEIHCRAQAPRSDN